jgi:hypothetical protein
MNESNFNLSLLVENYVDSCILENKTKQKIIEEITQKVDKAFDSSNLLIEKKKLKRQISQRFTGRGKTWIMIHKEDVLWKYVASTLRNSLVNKEKCNDLMDTFEIYDFAFARYHSVNLYFTNFELRIWGSLISSKTKVSIENLKAINLSYLEGTPIKLGLESKIEKFKDKPVQKEIDFPKSIFEL